MTAAEIEIVRKALNRAFAKQFGAPIYRPEDGRLSRRRSGAWTPTARNK